MHSSSVVVVVVVWCGVLIRLEYRVALWLATGFCVSGGILFLAVAPSGIRLWDEYERLRLWVCAFCGCLFRPVVVCLVRCGL